MLDFCKQKVKGVWLARDGHGQTRGKGIGMRKAVLLAAAAAFGISSSPALADVCSTGSVGDYSASGFSCNVGPITFSNIQVTTVGAVDLGNFTVFNVGGEYGLTLNYASSAVGGNTNSDVLWQYSVTGDPSIIDAFASLTGTITGTGSATLSEQLLDPITLTTLHSINLTGINTSQTITFDPVFGFYVFKDQQNFSGVEGSAFTSAMTNAFSVAVPGPLVGAGIPGLMAACLSLVGLARRRRIVS